jgi:hypothetical protein
MSTQQLEEGKKSFTCTDGSWPELPFSEQQLNGLPASAAGSR